MCLILNWFYHHLRLSAHWACFKMEVCQKLTWVVAWFSQLPSESSDDDVFVSPAGSPSRSRPVPGRAYRASHSPHTSPSRAPPLSNSCPTNQAFLLPSRESHGRVLPPRESHSKVLPSREPHGKVLPPGSRDWSDSPKLMRQVAAKNAYLRTGQTTASDHKLYLWEVKQLTILLSIPGKVVAVWSL